MRKSWKTSIIGILAGIGLNVLEMLQNGHTDKKTILIGASISLLGLLSKDHNKE